MTPKRYEHWLYRHGRGHWPPVVLTLSVSVDWTRRNGSGQREYAELLEWQAVQLVRRDEQYTRVRQVSGQDRDGFWSLLRECVSSTKSLWIISADTRVALATLGVWDAIEEGRIVPYGSAESDEQAGAGPVPDVRAQSSSGDVSGQIDVGSHDMRELRSRMGEIRGPTGDRTIHARRHKEALIILSDPPIVLQLQLAGIKSQIMWVDAANYGLDVGASIPVGALSTLMLADWFCRAASTLLKFPPCGWRATAGQQAMHLFRSHFIDTQILSHTSRHATALESSGLFGGHNECYRTGRIRGPIYVYDFRSMYPYICATQQLPTRLVATTVRDTEAASYVADEKNYVIAEVNLDVRQPRFPVAKDGHIYYPSGRFTTVLAGEELSDAVRRGYVRGVRRAASYARSPALAAFARSLFAARQTSRDAGYALIEAWIKRLLVALPGKFAQRNRFWRTMPGAIPACDWGEWYSTLPGVGICLWRSIGGIVQVRMEGEYVNGAVPAIAVAVTSGARHRLHSAMDDAGWRNVYYVDTDSIVCNATGAKRLQDAGWVRPGEWGYLQLEIESDMCEIIDRKWYRVGNRLRHAGTPGGGDAYYSPVGPQPMQPWIGNSLRNHQRPADWREPVAHNSTSINTATNVGAGRRVRTPVFREW